MIIEKNISLHDKNWFQTGGNARFFAAPSNAQELQDALFYARDNQLGVFMLGQGANILIADTGFDGLVIRPQMISITTQRCSDTKIYVKADAGITMDALIEWCLERGIFGLEEFSGIPGTVGGSTYMNLHYYQFALDQFLDHAEIINGANGIQETVDKSWFNFGYDHSSLQEKKYYLLSATFKLIENNDPIAIAFARGRRQEIIRHRTNRYPSKNTCGSFFRNFHEDEVSLIINNKKIIYVGYYLDRIGVKGTFSVGGAYVSHQHANMLVTKEGATSNDIIALARGLQQKVFDQFGIIPQPECQLIGFLESPLLKK